MIGLYWHFCMTIFFLLPEEFLWLISVFEISQKPFRYHTENHELAVAKPFSGYFAQSERCLFGQVKNTVISFCLELQSAFRSSTVRVTMELSRGEEQLFMVSWIQSGRMVNTPQQALVSSHQYSYSN